MSDSPPTVERQAFAQRLIALRKQANYPSKAAFARDIGVEPPRYCKWERAGSEPDIHHLCRIQKLTGASLDFLLAGLVPGMTGVAGRETFPTQPHAKRPPKSA